MEQMEQMERRGLKVFLAAMVLTGLMAPMARRARKGHKEIPAWLDPSVPKAQLERTGLTELTGPMEWTGLLDLRDQ